MHVWFSIMRVPSYELYFKEIKSSRVASYELHYKKIKSRVASVKTHFKKLKSWVANPKWELQIQSASCKFKVRVANLKCELQA